jgi:hypothetical protein
MQSRCADEQIIERQAHTAAFLLSFDSARQSRNGERDWKNRNAKAELVDETKAVILPNRGLGAIKRHASTRQS